MCIIKSVVLSAFKFELRLKMVFLAADKWANLTYVRVYSVWWEGNVSGAAISY